MASSIPYDADLFDADHNPFAEETSPFSSHKESDETHDEQRDEGNSIYGGINQSVVHTDESVSDVHGNSEEGTKDNKSNEVVDVPVTNTETPAIPKGIANSNGLPGSGKKRPLKKYRLSIKVTAIERHGKKDPIIRFDAYTTLPRFRTSMFRDIRRTHNEFIKFFEHLNGANPECFVPSVPPSVTSAGAGTEEDEEKLKAKMQLWFDRVCSNPILARDEEMIYFIEADFGYSPVVKRKPPATGLTRKAMKQLKPPPDEVTELRDFRPMIKQIYAVGVDAHAKLEKVSKARRGLGSALNEFGTKTLQTANLEAHQGMINMWRKLGKTLTYLSDLELVKATAESASLGDALQQCSADAYVAKEALTNRHLLMRELLKAQASTEAKHQTAIRVKASTNINPSKVDEAIAALEEATKVEEQLTNKLHRVSENMLFEKKILLSHIEADLSTYIKEYTVRMIDSERRALFNWESIRLDIRAVDANGGLSRLGRESTPANRRAALSKSQSLSGDSWSGDRTRRAVDVETSSSKVAETTSVSEDESELTVDAKSAASLLAGSTF